MQQGIAAKLAELDDLLSSIRRVAVAVSGGVDSMTLATAAHRRLGTNAVMYHAISPAVPYEATERVRMLSERLRWSLEVVDAGEFTDEDYLRNPVDRCFYCKSNLYAAIARSTDATIVSGANLDDLADYRPGLTAAMAYHVRHPYVEARIGKPVVRGIARALGLEEMADLPASPCLSSRLETGIRVTAEALSFVHEAERLVQHLLKPRTVRCRIRHSGVVIELDDAALERAVSADGQTLRESLERLRVLRGSTSPVRFERYRTGSAFLRA